MSIKKDILWRVGITYFGFFLFAVLIVWKIVYLQLFEGDKWREMAKRSTLTEATITPGRGNIYAAGGRLLATSVPYYEIRMDLGSNALTNRVFYKGVDSLSLSLYRLFRHESPKTRDEYRRELISARQRGDRFYLIKSRVNYMQLQQMRNFPIWRLGQFKGGFIYIQKDQRVRPHDNLAARLVGYTMADRRRNVVGIEGAFDADLGGVEGIAIMQKVAGGIWMPVKDRNEVDPKDGRDVVSTIDINFQDVAERALYRQLAAQHADYGCVVLMEVKTGRVLAMANLGRDKAGNYRELRNYAVAESVEPGSTFKLPVLLAALEDNLVQLHDTIDTGNGLLKHYDQVFRDENHDRGGSGKISVQRAFEVSSNVAMVKIVTQGYKGKEGRLIDRLYHMQLNQKLGLDIRGEGVPYIKYPGDKYWSGISLAMMSHGYEVKLTPLQTLAYYNAIANNGKMVRPRFVDEIRQNGRTVKTFHTEVISPSICSRHTIKKAHQLLEGVVENGTARNLRNPNFKMAGKTGTSQIFDVESGSYRSARGVLYQASFVGYFPANEPKYSCIVVVNAPSRNIYHGNEVAGPVFQEIARKVYALDFSGHLKEEEGMQAASMSIPFSKDGLKEDLTTVAGLLDIPLESKRAAGEWVTTSRNEKGISLQTKNITDDLVPNVVMMGAKDAAYLLGKSGLNVIVKGRGSVRAQSAPPGTRIRRGETIILEMSQL